MIGQHRIAAADGSALLSTLALVTIVSILVGSVLAVELLHRRMATRAVHELQAYYAARGAIHGHLAQNDYLQNTPGGGHASEVRVRESRFGGFRMLRASATVGTERSVVLALAARRPSELMKNAVVSTHGGSTLTLTRSTRITGDILTGMRGMLTRPLKGEPFSGYHRGQVIRRPNLPDRIFDAKQYVDAAGELRRLLPVSAEDEDVAGDFEDFRESVGSIDTVRFAGDLVVPVGEVIVFHRAKTVAVAGDLVIDGALYVCPETRIIASGEVSIAGTVTGRHAVIVAHSLRASDGLDASLQIVASDSIALRGSARLTYPSAAIVLGRTADTIHRGNITLSDSSRIEGLVAVVGSEAEDVSDQTEILVGRSAAVEGALVGTRVEIEGTIIGTAIGTFGFYESPSTYVNWIRSGIYDAGGRRVDMLFSDGLAEAGPWDVVWLTELGPRQLGDTGR